MRSPILIIVAITACKSEKAPANGLGSTPAASCDLVGRTITGDTHSCTDILDPDLVESQETFCKEAAGTFAKGTACSTEGRLGGCVEPNGTIRWTYKGDDSCVNGLKFKGGKAPKLGTITAYRCGNDKVCIEEYSALDLAKTGMKTTCDQLGGTFAAGACPAQNAVARCALRTRSGDSTRVYYAPGATADGVKTDCDDADGTLTPAP